MPTSAPDYDVAILGAGPAGTACALALRGRGLRVALLDKAQFPRDKVCGDAVPGQALKALRRLDPAYADALARLEPRDDVRRSRLVAPSGRALTLSWKLPTFNSPRLAFDHALLELVRAHTAAEILENTPVKTLRVEADRVTLATAAGVALSARLVVGCDGAHSAVRRHLAPPPARTIDRGRHCAAVRAYYAGVAGVEAGTTEFFFLKKYLAGYLWVFPVGAGVCNVGLGMLSETAAAQRVELRQLLPELLATHPGLAGRFAAARPLGPVAGFGLPLGGGTAAPGPLSGPRHLLCGDAAALIDPLQGHGIDTAVQSGILAAAQAVRSCRATDFSAEFLTQYDAEVSQKIWPKLARSYRLMRFLSTKPWLVNAAAHLAAVPGLQPLMQRVVG